MSADNGFLIKKIADKKYKVLEYCASLDEPEEDMTDYGTFETLEVAIKKAQGKYSEYGLSFIL